MKLLEIFSKRGLAPVMVGEEFHCHCPYPENHSADSRKRKQFYVNPEKGVYVCFSCGAKGSLYHLLTKKFKLPVEEALEVAIPSTDVKKEVVEEFDLVIDYSTPPTMFLSKDFSPEVLRRFKVGVEYRHKKEVAVIPLYESFETPSPLRGVAYRTQNGIHKQIWYESGFDRANYLYNFNPKWKEAVLVEGFTDTWRLHSYGVNAFAQLGSSLNEGQAKLLSNLRTLYVMLDNDRAGRKGMYRVNDLLSRVVPNILYCPVTSDPGDLKSKRELLKSMNQAVDFAQFQLLLWECIPDEYYSFTKKRYGNRV